MAWPAMYPGVCDECGKRYQPGERIRVADLLPDNKRTYRHETCPDKKTPPLCGLCYTYHVGECI